MNNAAISAAMALKNARRWVMTREWFSFRLLKPSSMNDNDHLAYAISDVVAALVRQLRAADTDGRWHFQRFHDQRRHDIEVRFYATPAVIDELKHGLHVQTTRHQWSTSIPPNNASEGSQAIDINHDLSSISSDLALELLGDGLLDEENQLNTAALHLHFLTSSIPAGNRSAFLFTCWQHWSRNLIPRQRVELMEYSDKYSDDIFRRIADTALGTPRRDGWRRYFQRVQALITGHRPADHPPMRYLLFENAQLTHNRLGVPADVQALAAGSLRAALAKDPAAPEQPSWTTMFACHSAANRFENIRQDSTP